VAHSKPTFFLSKPTKHTFLFSKPTKPTFRYELMMNSSGDKNTSLSLLDPHVSRSLPFLLFFLSPFIFVHQHLERFFFLLLRWCYGYYSIGSNFELCPRKRREKKQLKTVLERASSSKRPLHFILSKQR
jgi:hypothetical protein